MGKRKQKSSTHIGGNFEGNNTQGNDNFVDNEITINKGLTSDELIEVSDRIRFRSRWDEQRSEFLDNESRKIIGSIIISILSAIAIGEFWEYTFQWSMPTVPFLISVITFLLHFIPFTRFGVRQSIVIIFLLSTGYVLLIKYAVTLDTWMNIGQFVGTAGLGVLGIFIGLFAGVFSLFWKPFGD